MYLSVIFLPFFSFFFLGFFSNYFGRWGAVRIAIILLGISCIISYLIFYEITLSNSKVIFYSFIWFNVLDLKVLWGFLFDSLTSVMLLVVCSISFLVHIYSISYMAEDPHLPRFLAYLSLFTFFMLCLITCNNFVQLFLGWEGVGISSYLLINFWFTRLQANKAAIKAIIVNRFGDFGLLLALSIIFFIFKSFNFGVIFSLVDSLSTYYIPFFVYEVHAISIIVFFIFLGAVGKSAQIGLHTWLPDAMEGPTPVSALIHAATMVTAGVFILLRTSILLEYSTLILIVIVIIGAFTAFFAGTIGIFQNDLKRVIAYSTCSQLGYMIFACGLSNYSVSIFHLMNHAFFKALLFLSAGSIIHALFDEQDMRKMGGLFFLMPYTFGMFIIGSLALMAFPFTTGYYSKDIILELAYSNIYMEGLVAYWFGLVGACCTSFYSFRLLYYTFICEINSYKRIIKYIHDAPNMMFFSLFFLSLGSIFIGYICKDMFIGFGTDFWGSSFVYYNSIGNLLLVEAEFLGIYIKMLPVFLSILCASLALLCYEYYLLYFLYKLLEKDNIYLYYNFFSKKWYFDVIYNYYFVDKLLKFGYLITFKIIDRGFLELFGPTGLIRTFKLFLVFFYKLQSGYIFNYIFGMVVSFIFLIYFICFFEFVRDYCCMSILNLCVIGVILYYLHINSVFKYLI